MRLVSMDTQAAFSVACTLTTPHLCIALDIRLVSMDAQAAFKLGPVP